MYDSVYDKSTGSDFHNALLAIQGLEEGHYKTDQVYQFLKDQDPVVVHLALQFIRSKYPSSHPLSEGVTMRILDLSNVYADIVKLSAKGEKDILVSWFHDTYNFRDFFSNPEAFLTVVFDKIEG